MPITGQLTQRVNAITRMRISPKGRPDKTSKDKLDHMQNDAVSENDRQQRADSKARRRG